MNRITNQVFFLHLMRTFYIRSNNLYENLREYKRKMTDFLLTQHKIHY